MAFNYQVHCGSHNTVYINRDNIHDAYYNEVRKYPILTEKEERELINTYNFAKTKKEREMAKEKLITSNLRFVMSIAKKLGTANTFLDLVNEGNIGLIKAIEKYDPSKSYRLITYAVSWVVAYIKTYQMTQVKSVVPPNTLKLHNYVKNVANEFFLKNERNPTPQEIADMIMKKYNFKITNLEDVELGRMISIEEKFNVSEDDTFEDSNVYIQRTSVSNTINTDIENDYKKYQLNFFLGQLTKREREIIERVYGIGCEQESFDTIALDMKLGGERVRQICVNAMRKMQQYGNQIKH